MTDKGLSDAAAAFLVETKETDPLTLFREYGRFLLQSSNAWTLPVPLECIRKEYKFQRHEAQLGRRGFLLGDAVFVNSDDLDTVQRFTEAHELMETLYVALQQEKPSRFSTIAWQEFGVKKESFCEAGAAELLMPADLFFPLVEDMGVSLVNARALSTQCHVSLTATIRRMLDADLTATIFALLKEGHKKSQYVPSKVGQGVLWGNPKDWDPPAELRVWKSWSAPQVETFVCWNESIGRDTIVYETLHANAPGVIRHGIDLLDLEYVKGQYQTESMLVTIDDSPVIMALIHLSQRGETM